MFKSLLYVLSKSYDPPGEIRTHNPRLHKQIIVAVSFKLETIYTVRYHCATGG